MPAQGTEEDRLRRWHDNVANGSEVYADVSARRLRAFCTDSKVTAQAIVDQDLEDLRRTLEDYLAREKKRGHSGEYIRTTLKAVRSWRKYNGKDFPEGLKVPNATLSPRVDREKVPAPADLNRVLLAAKPHERVGIALMAFSGCRPQVIGNYLGTDGLVLDDLPELVISRRHVEFSKVPARILVRAANSKAKHGYLTFIGAEGCKAIIQYLEQRQVGGEKLSGSSDLVHPEKADKRFVRALNVGDGIRRAMRAAGLDQRPYVWRSYFLSRMLEASNAGKVSDRYVEFWSGHRGDVTARHYTTGRANMSTTMVEDMRSAYKRCEPFLSTASTGGDPNEGGNRVLKALLEARGMPAEEAQKVDISAKSDAELVELFKKLGAATPRVPSQRVISKDRLESLMAEGWEYVANLGDDRIVVRSPGSWGTQYQTARGGPD